MLTSRSISSFTARLLSQLPVEPGQSMSMDVGLCSCGHSPCVDLIRSHGQKQNQYSRQRAAPAVLVQAWIPSSLGGWGRRMSSSNPAQAIWPLSLSQNKTLKKEKKKARVATQCKAFAFNPYHQQKKKKENNCANPSANLEAYSQIFLSFSWGSMIWKLKVKRNGKVITVSLFPVNKTYNHRIWKLDVSPGSFSCFSDLSLDVIFSGESPLITHLSSLLA